MDQFSEIIPQQKLISIQCKKKLNLSLYLLYYTKAYNEFAMPISAS